MTPNLPSYDTNWLEFSYGFPIRKTRGFVQIPAFNYPAVWGAKGPSLLTAQFNFTSTSAFYLTGRPTPPPNVSFLLCIRWRFGNTVFRYKLWDNVGEILGEDAGVAPLYSGQLVPQNFVLEIWNTSSGNAVNIVPQTLFTTNRSFPVDYTQPLVDYPVAVGVPFSNYAPIAPVLNTAGLLGRFQADLLNPAYIFGIPTWPDTFGSLVPLTQPTPGNQPTLNSLNPGVYGFKKPCAVFTKANSNYMAQTSNGLFPYPITIYMVMGLQSVSLSDSYGYFSDQVSGLGNKLGINSGILRMQYTSKDGASIAYDTGALPVNARFPILKLIINSPPAGGLLCELLGGGGTQTQVTNTGNTTTLKRLNIGQDGSGNYGDFALADLLIFNSSIPDGQPQDINIQQYLNNYWYGDFVLPANYDPGVAWLSN